MRDRLRTGFIAGALGALAITVIMLVMQLAMGATPMFVGTYQSVLGPSSLVVAELVGGVLFVLSGAVWGMLFTSLVKQPTLARGMLFGLAPALWLWLVVAPLMLGQPAFFGFQVPNLVMPFLFNVVVWGSITGWYSAEHMPQGQLASAD
jgi:hypothetical protein